MDTPSSTSALEYQLYMHRSDNFGAINQQYENHNNDGIMQIVAMEVA